MLWWDEQWLKMVEDNNLELEAKARYMDDLRAWLFGLRLGWKWINRELLFSSVWRKEEEDKGMTSLQKTGEVFEAMMNDICDSLRMTMESCDDFDAKMLPTLDLKIWVNDDNKCLYTFFEKPTATIQVIHKDSGMHENMRVLTLNQEVTRRMLNTSELLDDGVRCRVLDDFCNKMGNSGYEVRFMRKVIIGGITGYERKLARSRDRNKPGWKSLHESASRSAGRRNKKKIMEVSTCFKPQSRPQEEDQDIMELELEEQKLIRKIRDDEEKELEFTSTMKKNTQTVHDAHEAHVLYMDLVTNPRMVLRMLRPLRM